MQHARPERPPQGHSKPPTPACTADAQTQKRPHLFVCERRRRLSPFSLSLTVLPPGGSALEPSQVPHWPLGFSDRCSVSVGNGQGGKGHPAAGDSRRVNFGSR